MAPSQDRLSYQELAGAAERLAVRAGSRRRLDWVAAVEDLRDRLAAAKFVPRPVHSRVIATGGGQKQRVVSSLRVEDAVLAEALLARWRPLIEPTLLDSVHGYRKGRNTRTAAMALQEALRAGRHWLVFADVDDFFPSVDMKILRAELAALAPAALVDLTLSLLDPPLVAEDGSWKAGRGLPLGNALSPLLSNFYLAPVDRAMAELPVTYLRYGDDIVVAASDALARVKAEGMLERTLHDRHLRTKPSKTRHERASAGPSRYLGLLVDEGSIYEPVASKAPIVRAPPEFALPGDASGRTRIVYVAESGLWLRVEQGRLLAKRGKELVKEIPLHRIDRIVVFGHCGLSSGFIAACVRERIQVLFVVQRGRAFGSLVTEGLANPLRLRAQYALLADTARRRKLAMELLTAKLDAMLLRLHGRTEDKAELDALTRLRHRLESGEVEFPAERPAIASPDVEEPDEPSSNDLMGLEGAATAAYYRAFARRIRVPEFSFERRSKQPPRDRINSLLSFAYSLLYGEMQATLLAHGLDPMPAVLHELGRTHAALASDLIEPYRSLIADTFVLTFVNQRQAKADGFQTSPKGAVLMTTEARRGLLEAYFAA